MPKVAGEVEVSTRTRVFKRSGGRGLGKQCVYWRGPNHPKRPNTRCRAWACFPGDLCVVHSGVRLPVVRAARDATKKSVALHCLETIAELTQAPHPDAVRLRACRVLLRYAAPDLTPPRKLRRKGGDVPEPVAAIEPALDVEIEALLGGLRQSGSAPKIDGEHRELGAVQ